MMEGVEFMKDKGSHNLSEYADKLTTILVWSQDNPDFDPNFVNSLIDQLTKKGYLSDKQKDAIDNIIQKFKIE